MAYSKKSSGYGGVFSTRLRELADEQKITQEKLAVKLGVSRQAISKYMDGGALPNAEKLATIAKFFNVSSDYLIGLTNARSYENAATGKELGLSDEGEKTLRQLALDSKKGLLLPIVKLKVINTLLSNKGEKTLKALAELMYTKKQATARVLYDEPFEGCDYQARQLRMLDVQEQISLLFNGEQR